MTREELIEARAKYLNEQRSDYGWNLLNANAKQYFIKKATEDVEWFASQGLGFKSDIKLPEQTRFRVNENPCDGCEVFPAKQCWDDNLTKENCHCAERTVYTMFQQFKELNPYAWQEIEDGK